MIDQVAPFPLAEQDLPCGEEYLLGRPVGVGEMRCQLDHPVGQLADPVVVGGDDDDPAGAGQVSQEAQDPFDLDVIEVGRWFVRQDQRRIVHEAPWAIATRCCRPPDICAGR